MQTILKAHSEWSSITAFLHIYNRVIKNKEAINNAIFASVKLQKLHCSHEINSRFINISRLEIAVKD